MIHIIIFIILFILFLIYYNKYNIKSIYCIPIILLAIEIFRVFFMELGVEEGYNGIVVSLFSLYILLGSVYLFTHSNNNIIMLVCLILAVYISMRLDFAEQVFNIASRYLGFIFPIILLPISYAISKNIYDIKLLNRCVYSATLIFVFYVVLSSLLRYGPNMYDTGIIFGFIYEQWYFGSLFIILIPLISNNRFIIKKNKGVVIVLAIVITIILVLTFRRTTLLIMVIGLFVYMLYAVKTKKNIRLLSLFILIFPFILFIVYSFNLYDHRISRFSDNYHLTDEGRIIELYLVYDLISSHGNSKYFGTGKMFDETGRYGWVGGYDRALHGTYARILFGGGLVGLIFYILLFFVLIIYTYKYSSRANNKTARNLAAINMALIISYMVTAFTGAMGTGAGIAYVSTNFLYIGTILGVLKKYPWIKER